MSNPYSYQEVARKYQGGDLLSQGPITLLRFSTSKGVEECPADLPWALSSYTWMLPFLLCLEKHGREDCMCWKEPKSERHRLTQYVGWRKSEQLLLKSNAAFRKPWEREKSRALKIYAEKNGSLPSPDITIPWAEELLRMVKEGYSPSGAARILKKSRFCVTSARQKHPWFNERLIELGYKPRAWKAQFPPARRAK